MPKVNAPPGTMPTMHAARELIKEGLATSGADSVASALIHACKTGALNYTPIRIGRRRVSYCVKYEEAKRFWQSDK